MKSIRWLFFCLAPLLIVPSGIQAQSDEEPWPIVEQCISLEINPPPDWTFDGTLILSSQFRVHTFRQGWTTPRIMAFYRSYFDTALSPDGRWFAVIVGNTDLSSGMLTVFSITAIQVFSTTDDTFYSIPWENEYAAFHRVYGHRLYWADENHLLYSKDIDGGENWFLVNPFTSEITPWEQFFRPSYFGFDLAPDAQKGLSSDWPEPFLSIHANETVTEVAIRSGFNGIWHPSSDYFLIETFPEDSTDPVDLLMLDLNGEIVYDIFRTQSDYGVGTMVWSPDGRYLAFVDDHLYIADLDAERVIDTCIATSSTIAWSPTRNQLAVVGGSSDHAIRIIDFDRAASYIVGYHAGGIIGWRADE
jgi:WD40 repeat protein